MDLNQAPLHRGAAVPSMQCTSHINSSIFIIFFHARIARTLATDCGTIEAGVLSMLCFLQVHAVTLNYTVHSTNLSTAATLSATGAFARWSAICLIVTRLCQCWTGTQMSPPTWLFRPTLWAYKWGLICTQVAIRVTQPSLAAHAALPQPWSPAQFCFQLQAVSSTRLSWSRAKKRNKAKLLQRRCDGKHEEPSTHVAYPWLRLARQSCPRLPGRRT